MPSSLSGLVSPSALTGRNTPTSTPGLVAPSVLVGRSAPSSLTGRVAPTAQEGIVDFATTWGQLATKTWRLESSHTWGRVA
jgi:hypothetical protein